MDVTPRSAHNRPCVILILAGMAIGMGLGSAVEPSMAQATATLRVELPSNAPEENDREVLELPKDVFAPAEGSTENEAQEQAIKAQRLQVINQVTIDRRPSTILKTKAAPEEVEGEGDEKADPKDDQPTVSAPAPAPAATAAQPRSVPVSSTIRASTIVVSSRAATLSTGMARPSGTTAIRLSPSGTVVSGASAEALAAAQAAAMTAQATQTAADPNAVDTAAVNEAVEAFRQELKSFERSVTLGDWKAVGNDLEGLEEDEAKALYSRILQGLPSIPRSAMMGVRPEMQPYQEKNEVSCADVIDLARIAPIDLDDATLGLLGRLLAYALGNGQDIEDALTRIRAEVASAEDEDESTESAVDRLQGARLLLNAGRAVEAGEFLPSLDEAIAKDERKTLNMVARHLLAIHRRDGKPAQLEEAWRATQAVLATGAVEETEKTEALTRAVELASRVREELGQRWLVDSFRERPELGLEIIAAIGTAASQGLAARPNDTDGRLRDLSLLREAVEALIDLKPGEAAETWSESLTLLAVTWLREARHSLTYDRSTARGPILQRDIYGNIFYSSTVDNQAMMMSRMNNNRIPSAIPMGKLLPIRPHAPWRKAVEPGLQPELEAVVARLHLKVGEEDEAFPHIESLAEDHPDLAHELAEEFLRVWTRNHDPNAARSLTNSYIFMYGFEQKAEGIPLTRSKQQRNLKDLASWIGRLRDLPIPPLDEKLLTRAFTTCHSAAEVYRLEAIESVFGSLDALEPDVLASLIQQMRLNLSGLWRLPATQQNAKTNRRKKDIEAEVRRGYQVARRVIEGAMETYPDHHALVRALAAIRHDENDYLNDLQPSSEFTARRLEALDLFARAADLYAERVPELEEDEFDIEPYYQWFSAALGACDLNQIEEGDQAVSSEASRIREAIAALPGDSADEHLGRMANGLFTRMSALNPAVKFRYLRLGFEIVGDDERAVEARKVYDYYQDLVTEIDLVTRLDGSAEVGHTQPFGLFVELRHTKEIERESGGFGRYLQNQNAGSIYYYNYGRPLENYRDKFEEAIRGALEEGFDVLSVTFQSDKVTSKATAEYGWRVTPYAYLLLQARGPEVDTIPPLRLDLDFLDTSGYAVIPVESATIPIDSRPERGEPRPVEALQVTQTLDERQADDGVLVLEVRAVARGLVPDLDGLIELPEQGFRVDEVEDDGGAVSKFDEESEQTAILSERNWQIRMVADADAESSREDGATPTRPDEFQFASAVIEPVDLTYQRYVDSDLESVDPIVSLERRYGSTSYGWVRWLILGLVALAIVAMSVPLLRPKRVESTGSRFQVPDPITPFTVLGLLRDIRLANDLNPADRTELDRDIERIETYYFIRSEGDEPKLRIIAERWTGQSEGR